LKTMSEGQTLMPGDVLATGTVSDACKELSNVEPTLITVALARWSRYRSRPTNLPQVRR
jgi:2-keto-4-pentenoate hydratase/2-oxohepta-3-ene-1,7-dioic acid hydratase in catechol pathway